MVVDLNEAVDIGNYLYHLNLNPGKNVTDSLLGKYRDAINLSQEISSEDFLQSSRNQRYERNIY